MRKLIQNLLITLLLLSPGISFAQTTVVTIPATGGTAVPNQGRFGIVFGGSGNYGQGDLLKDSGIVNGSYMPTPVYTLALDCTTGTSTTNWVGPYYGTNGYTANFFNGASYTVYSQNGGTLGTGTITANTSNIGSSSSAYISLTLGTALSAVPTCGGSTAGSDLLVISQFPQTLNVQQSFENPPSSGTFDTVDVPTGLPNGIVAKQSIVLNAGVTWANLTDRPITSGSTLNYNSSSIFVMQNFNGSYTLSFYAKCVTTPCTGNSSVFRNGGGATLFSASDTLTTSWALYTHTFTASEAGSQVQNLMQQSFSCGTNSCKMWGATMKEGSTLSGNTTPFRDAVVQKIKSYNPGVIRFMNPSNWCSPVADMIGPDENHRFCGMDNTNISSILFSYGYLDAMLLAQNLGNVDVWLDMSKVPTAADATLLMQWLGGPSGTAGGNIRIAEGYTTPWTTALSPHTIYLELGNEAWNNFVALQFESGNGKAYGTMIAPVIAAIKASPYYSSSQIKIIENGQMSGFGAGGFGAISLQSSGCTQGVSPRTYCPDYIDVAPYTIGTLNNFTNIQQDIVASGVYFNSTKPTFGTCSDYQTSSPLYLSQQFAACYGVNLDIYEDNVSPVQGSATPTQAQMSQSFDSVGAGLALGEDKELQRRDAGVVGPDNAFAFTDSYSVSGTGNARFGAWDATAYMATGPGQIGTAWNDPDKPWGIVFKIMNNAIGTNNYVLPVTQSGTPTVNYAANNGVPANSALPLVNCTAHNNNASNYTFFCWNNDTVAHAVSLTGAGAPVSGTTVSLTKFGTPTNAVTDNNDTALPNAQTTPGVTGAAVVTPTASNVSGSTLTGYSLPANSMIAGTYTLGTGTTVTPVITLAAGNYTGAQTTNITASTSGSIVYYTQDGSTPTTSSTVYTGSIPLTYGQTLKAIAVAPGYAASSVASSTYTFTAGTGASTLALSNPNFCYPNQNCPQTATVTPTTLTTTPTGTVTFTFNGSTLGTVALNSSGVAVLNTTALPFGSSITVYAIYNGDVNYAALSQVGNNPLVMLNTTATTLSGSATTIASGGSITLTSTTSCTSCTTTPGTPAGTGLFYDFYIERPTATAASGSSTLTVSSATGIIAGEGGSGIGASSVSGPGIPYGDYATATSGTTITLAIPTTAALSATPVTFSGNYLLGGTTAALNGSGTMTYTTSALVPGEHYLQADYNSDNSVYAEGRSTKLHVTVTQSATACSTATSLTGAPAVYYVANNGVDTAAGTCAAPFLTVNHALGLMTTPGDVILLRQGDTFPEKITTGIDGTSAATYKFGNYVGTGVTVTKPLPIITGRDTLSLTWTAVSGAPGTYQATYAGYPSKLCIDSVGQECTVIGAAPNYRGAFASGTYNPYDVVYSVNSEGQYWMRLTTGTMSSFNQNTNPGGWGVVPKIPVAAQTTGLANVEAYPGYFYANGSTIYVHLADGSSPASHVVQASNTARPFGFDLTGASNISIQNLAIEGFTYSGIKIQPASLTADTADNISISGSYIYNSGNPEQYYDYADYSSYHTGDVSIGGIYATAAPGVTNTSLIGDVFGSVDILPQLNSNVAGIAMYGVGNGVRLNAAAYGIASNSLTVTNANTFTVGQTVTLNLIFKSTEGVYSFATFTTTIATASSTQFSVAYTAANDTGTVVGSVSLNNGLTAQGILLSSINTEGFTSLAQDGNYNFGINLSDAHIMNQNGGCYRISGAPGTNLYNINCHHFIGFGGQIGGQSAGVTEWGVLQWNGRGNRGMSDFFTPGYFGLGGNLYNGLDVNGTADGLVRHHFTTFNIGGNAMTNEYNAEPTLGSGACASGTCRYDDGILDASAETRPDTTYGTGAFSYWGRPWSNPSGLWSHMGTVPYAAQIANFDWLNQQGQSHDVVFAQFNLNVGALASIQPATTAGFTNPLIGDFTLVNNSPFCGTGIQIPSMGDATTTNIGYAKNTCTTYAPGAIQSIELAAGTPYATQFGFQTVPATGQLAMAAVAIYADGTKQSIPGGSITWASSVPANATIAVGTTNDTTPAIGTVANNGTFGIVNGVTTGSAVTSSTNITATYGGVTSPVFALTVTVGYPVLSPGAGGYSTAQTVTMTDPTPTAVICYRTDGGTPSATAGVCGSTSTTYTGPLSISATTTITALATTASPAYTSNVETAVYVISGGTVATPTATPGSGSYGPPQSVILADATSGANIFYCSTSYGSACTPGTNYTGVAIGVGTSQSICTNATATGMTNSATVCFNYLINGTVSTPIFAPPGGSYTSAQTVTIASSTSGATIYYTTDGSVPTTSSAIYGGPIVVSISETVKALATKAGFTNSAIGSAAYTIGTGPCSNYVILTTSNVIAALSGSTTIPVVCK